MKKLIFLSSLIFLAACASQPAVQPTTTLLADTATATALPTATFTPEPADTPTEEPAPEGTYIETLPTRVIAVVRDGVVVEIEEGPIEVAIDEATGRYLFERVDGQWVEYTPRIYVVGEENIIGSYDHIEAGNMPVEILQNVTDIIVRAEQNSNLTRDGQPVTTGYDQDWPIEEWNDGRQFIW